MLLLLLLLLPPEVRLIVKNECFWVEYTHTYTQVEKDRLCVYVQHLLLYNCKAQALFQRNSSERKRLNYSALPNVFIESIKDLGTILQEFDLVVFD